MSNRYLLQISVSERTTLLGWIQINLIKYDHGLLYDSSLEALIPGLISAKITIQMSSWVNNDNYAYAIDAEELLSILYVTNIENFDIQEDDISIELMQILIKIHIKTKSVLTS